MVDAHSRNIGNRNKLDMPSFRFNAGQRPWDSAFAMTLQNREVIQKNLELLKAEVKKRHFLILFFPPISFTYCKVDNYAFNYQIAILKLAEKPFYEVGC